MHDRVASTMALARTMLGGLDVSRESTSVRTASLKLLLETLLEFEPTRESPLPAALRSPRAQAVGDQQRRTVAGVIASFTAAKEDDDLFREPPRGSAD